MTRPPNWPRITFPSYINRGNTYFKLGKHDRAIEDYDRVIEINPEWSWPYVQ